MTLVRQLHQRLQVPIPKLGEQLTATAAVQVPSLCQFLVHVQQLALF
jgi:hypothetical protein